jgi:hypothetical protein
METKDMQIDPLTKGIALGLRAVVLDQQNIAPLAYSLNNLGASLLEADPYVEPMPHQLADIWNLFGALMDEAEYDPIGISTFSLKLRRAFFPTHKHFTDFARGRLTSSMIAVSEESPNVEKISVFDMRLEKLQVHALFVSMYDMSKRDHVKANWRSLTIGQVGGGFIFPCSMPGDISQVPQRKKWFGIF